MFEKAWKILKENGYTVKRTDVVAVEVPDRPGGLHSILAALNKKGINVEYMYAYVERSGQNAIIIFRFDPISAAIEVLAENGFKVLPGDKVYQDVKKLSVFSKKALQVFQRRLFSCRASYSLYTHIAMPSSCLEARFLL